MKRSSLPSTSNTSGSLSPPRSRSPSPTRREPPSTPDTPTQISDPATDQTPLDQPIATTPAPHGMGVMRIPGMEPNPQFIALLLDDSRHGRRTDSSIVQRHYLQQSLTRMVHAWPLCRPRFRIDASEPATPLHQQPSTGSLSAEFLARMVHLALDSADTLTTPEQARDLRKQFGFWARTSHFMRTLTLPHFPAVVLCSLRLQATSHTGTPKPLPLDRLIDWQIRPPSGQAPLPLLAWVPAMVQAANSIPDDEAACETLLTLGRELLRMSLKSEVTDSQRQTLMVAPQCIFHALRVRMLRSTDASAPVASGLSQCFNWVKQEGGSAALPCLAELYFAVAQAARHNQDAWLDPIMLYPDTVIDALRRANREEADPLVEGLDRLVELMPNPWNPSLLPAPRPADISRALRFLATYPHPPLGFVPEVLAHLQTLELNEQQQALLQACRDKLSSHGLPLTATPWH